MSAFAFVLVGNFNKIFTNILIYFFTVISLLVLTKIEICYIM